ncbi:FHA domain-containing protein [Nostoc sp. CCY 9925]|uniref:FHA domain-containing protein n=1 Tax=Nostoc sp. CCY 9925 TaxID=3103865 RepID=UPI0039C6EEEB
MDTDFEYETLHNKIQQLKKASIIENDISSKFKLEQQIKDAEQELVELESKLIALEKNRIILKLNGSNHQVYCIFSKQATIGRASTCDFVINDDYHQISNLHAGIFYNLDKNEYWIEDLNSANGTYIDEAKIEKPTQLAWNAKIKLGTSLSFVFQHNKDDSLSPAVLIQHDHNGEEIARYIVIPKGKVLVGTNPKEVVRFPKLRDERSLGSIERKTDGFYFISVDNQETLLKHNIELSLDFLKVRITIPSVVQKQVNDDTIIAESSGEKKGDRQIVKPTGYETPSNLWKINIFLGLFVFLFGIIFNLICFKPDKAKISSQWINECVLSLNRKESRSLVKDLFEHQKSHWRSKSSIWPPKESVVYIVSTKPVSNNIDITKIFINESGLSGKEIRDDDIFTLNDFNEGKFIQLKKQKAPNAPWISIIALDSLGILYLKIDYWSADGSRLNSSISTFEWDKKEFLHWHTILILLFTICLSYSIRNWKIQRYRNQLQEQYEIFQKERTKKIFEAKSRLEEARKLAQSGELAQALVIINSLLKSVSIDMPVYNEVTDLKKMILAQVELGGGAIAIAQFNKNNGKVFQSGNTSNLLYLRVLGTPYAYQAPYGLENISIGRQRRKSGTSLDAGNDVVIRVPGADSKSLRISRRHLEIKRIDTEYFVIDKSGGHTKLNGKFLKENDPFRLQTGDRLLIADVLTLEVIIQTKISGTKVGNLIRIDCHNTIQDGLLIEASIGDLITEVSYE